MLDLSQSRIRQIAINCKDVARAKTFYSGTLGLRFLFDAGPNLAFVDCGGVRFMLTTSTENPEHDHPGSILYFLVEDIEETHKSLSEKGTVFVEQPHKIADMPDHQLWLAAFADTEGNTLCLMEEKR